MKIGVIDYGVGNIRSICNAIVEIGHDPILIKEKADEDHFDKIILPGVGAFPPAMQKIEETGLADFVKRFDEKERGIIGICLGMQLLSTISEENGNTQGLDLIPGTIKKLPNSAEKNTYKLPMIAWKQVQVQSAHQNHKLAALCQQKWFYFVHSYCFSADDEDCRFGVYNLEHDIKVTSIVAKNFNIGFQFHPERSGADGLALLKGAVTC